MKLLGMLIFGSVLFLSCAVTEEGGNAVAKKDINAVMQAHTAELMALPGVTGLAISELEDKTPCIWVMILEPSVELEWAIPDSLDGHPVRVVVSGEIKPMDGN